MAPRDRGPGEDVPRRPGRLAGGLQGGASPLSARDRLRRRLIAYDIPDDRRRSRAARVLEGFGDRVQYSVFVVDALPAQFVSLQAALEAVLDPGEDSVLVCDLGLTATLGAEQFSFLGRSREISVDGPIII
ncbi:CRISPR-associated endonuclease Cas2 [Micrococcus luteus]|uniref:CRISPR-associated endonuclease Cas2 n=1 Tax=Actinomycetes TaxID=1760 RepID=UPI001E5FFC88|nr:MULTISPECIES: CRISPR-associated endonuclease Cas2 [Micrococcus]MCK1801322.1 CRISPR-associated endonuclease Cas2 [Micrococcus sp. XM4230B]MCM3481123.1 CRISPR-associated endonuclease Cas2 [Micrococcus luteus]MCT1868319.1 CRISPR-associated endonuclease Cas2 [Micrococcus luteus]MCT2066598.1 CRISPR-associated endonuclease Cas2 [Micrococcus luteus]MCT2254801.1 CRISPR-associated endonuclease Cas2 [Micrococcus luteus]